MQKGYLLLLSSIAAEAVDAHGGAKPELPAIRVPPSPPVDTRLGFVSIATTSNRCRQPLLDSPPPFTPGSPRKAMGLGFGRRDEGRRMDGGAGVRQRRGKNEEECERRTGAAEKNGGVLLSLILSYRGNTGPYENTAPAGGSNYAPDIENGKGGRRSKIVMVSFQ